MSDEKDEELGEPDFDLKPGKKLIGEDDDADADPLAVDPLLAAVLPEEVEETPTEDDDEDGLDIESFDSTDSF